VIEASRSNRSHRFDGEPSAPAESTKARRLPGGSAASRLVRPSTSPRAV